MIRDFSRKFFPFFIYKIQIIESTIEMNIETNDYNLKQLDTVPERIYNPITAMAF